MHAIQDDAKTTRDNSFRRAKEEWEEILKHQSLLFIYIDDFFFVSTASHRTITGRCESKRGRRVFVEMNSRRRTFSMSVPVKKEAERDTKTRLSSLTRKDFLELVLNFLTTTRRLANDGLEEEGREGVEWTCFAFNWCLCLLFVRLMWLIDLIFINLKYPKVRWVRNIKCDWNKLRRYLFFSCCNKSLLDLWTRERLKEHRKVCGWCDDDELFRFFLETNLWVGKFSCNSWARIWLVSLLRGPNDFRKQFRDFFKDIL